MSHTPASPDTRCEVRQHVSGNRCTLEAGHSGRHSTIPRPVPCVGGTHFWPDDTVDGDTCNCGAWYRFADRIEMSR